MSRSPATVVLLIVAVLLTALSAFIGITTGMGIAHADVRGYRLSGALEWLFLAGLAVTGFGAGAAAIGLWRRRAWAVPAIAAIWPVFALICLVLDRITPTPGPGRPLWFYLAVGLVPAAIMVLVGRGQRPDERAGDFRWPRAR